MTTRIPSAVLVVAMCSAWLLGSGCQNVGRARLPPSVSTDSAVRDSLWRELVRTTSRSQPSPTHDQVTFSSDTSRIVPGLLYHWALYSPPQTVHALNRAVAITNASRVLIVRAPGDWGAAAAGWHPRSSEEVLQACAEIAYVTTSRRLPGFIPIPFTGPGTLENLPLPSPDYLLERLSSPSVHNAEGLGWTARFWAVEVADVKEYECRIGSTTSLSTLQVLVNYGTLPPI